VFASAISTQPHQLFSEVLTLEHADECFGRRRQTIGGRCALISI
jgi:hypothetical protein